MVRINRVILGGNLTRDPQLSRTNSGKDVTNFCIAVNNDFKNDNGEKQNDACFIDCEIWEKDAVTVNKYFKKGRPILVEGRLKLERWIDKETGGNRSKLRVSVHKFHFVDSPKENNSVVNAEDFIGQEEKEFDSSVIENADQI